MKKMHAVFQYYPADVSELKYTEQYMHITGCKKSSNQAAGLANTNNESTTSVQI